MIHSACTLPLDHHVGEMPITPCEVRGHICPLGLGVSEEHYVGLTW